MKLLEACQLLYSKGWLAACDGNASIRVDDHILITPSGRHKGFVEEHELARVTLNGTVLEGSPSSELAMHLAVYRLCPHARAVLHAHPPVATAWTLARPELAALPSEQLSESPCFPIVPFASPGSVGMGEALRPYLPQARALILARHGSLCWGESAEEAYFHTEHLEHRATTLLHADTLERR